MGWTVYGIMIIFGIFIILMIRSPSMSCFGRRVSSPLYPVLRKKKKRIIKTEDYGFDLGGSEEGKKDDDSPAQGDA